MLTLAAPHARRRRLVLRDIKAMRATWGQSVLLFLTDRCPVGCAHCSVDSRADSPSISDWPLFESIVAELCAMHAVACVGISGGEPFIERRGLEHAVTQLTRAGKHVVVYTSGVWAATSVPPWVTRVLAATSAVFLSTDGFHRATVYRETFMAAARAVVASGASLIVPALDLPDELRSVSILLARTFGDDWPARAEIMANPLLSSGRGSDVVVLQAPRPAAELGACSLARSPVIRYDGRAAACCNEDVIMGRGPTGLTARVTAASGVGDTLAGFARDPLHRLIGTLPVEAAAHVIGFHALDPQRHRSICDLCWALHQRSASLPVGAVPVFDIINRLASKAIATNGGQEGSC